MNQRVELINMLTKFENSEWELIALSSKKWKQSTNPTKQETFELLEAIEKANIECGSCGCEYDELYKKAILILKEILS